ncbi:MAG TPA: hypothetical protein EYG11_02470 [Candidatus Latescibacteria bacterium]|jgi:ectoine hydroxylase-related dioxygenase (phytanoyl-CoA dioxygenase family)|nr:hypothetical protein [Gemmatimonadota bacterium]HIG57001.1 hypothetical protein [Candidatus Handelsmanbacteria bacterium]HIL07543.1 hypothetical protein [Candidatus Latescibacterota bacterium]|tara:strand:- start:1330 stop:2097 length:768 start_codon:yes stop_codon:yes gene_type:complete
MTPLDQAINEIDVYGFTLVPDVLTPEQIGTLKNALIQSAERKGEDGFENRGGASMLVRNLPTLDPAFFQVIDHPVILPLLEHFLAQSLILGSLSARIVRPGDGLQNFHSDIPGHMLNPLSPVMMNTVWPLVDFNPKIGGTRIVPGSHKSGHDGPPEGFDVQHVFQPTCKAGSVLIFNGQCWHAGGANDTADNRYAVFAHYRKSMLMFQLDPHDNFPDEWFEQLNPRQRELLRMQQGLRALHAADEHFAQPAKQSK